MLQNLSILIKIIKYYPIYYINDYFYFTISKLNLLYLNHEIICNSE